MWGAEYHMGLLFASDGDFYRAITSFKRALILLKNENEARSLELDYFLALAYFLGGKYADVVHVVETTALRSVNGTFASFNDLLLMLYDSYNHLGRTVEAEHIYQLICSYTPENAEKIELLAAVRSMDFASLCAAGESKPYIATIVSKYQKERKSPRRARTLNALLPGAGYLYIGQKQTAFTAALVNALFIATAVHFFEKGNYAAGAITLSLESGWYFGGICGAAMGANYYNQRLYECYAQKIAQKEQFFPSLMIRYSF